MSRLPAVREHDSNGSEITPFVSDQHDVTETQLALSTFTNAAIDTQIATAKKFPRSIARFLKEAEALVCLNKRVAATCFYEIPRGGKKISGPSVRLAELAQNAWGNIRVSAMKTGDDGKYVTATAVGLDLEKNNGVSVTAEQQVVGSKGERYSDDMVRVASAAACAKARRNAIFALIPRTFIEELERMAREVARGTMETIDADREAYLEECRKISVPRADVFRTLGIEGKADMTLDHLEQLAGYLNAIKEKHATIDEIFGKPPIDVPSKATNGGGTKSAGLAGKIANTLLPDEPGANG